MRRILGFKVFRVQSFSHYCLVPFLPLLGSLASDFEVRLKIRFLNLGLLLQEMLGCLLQAF